MSAEPTARPSRLRPALWALAFLMLALLIVRTFAVDVYRVASSSMEPTLLEGEHVLVLYDRSVPARHDLVVLSRPGEPEPLVKRVAALPEESVQIVGGDCLIDGRRLPVDEARRPGPFQVGDYLGGASLVEHGGEYGRTWTRAEVPDGDDVWEVDAVALERFDPAGELYTVPDVTDDYLRRGEVVPGAVEVNDLEVECDVWIEGPTGRVRFGLNERGDDFWLELELRGAEDGGARALLLRTPLRTFETPHAEWSPPEVEELFSGSASIDPGRWHHVRFANVDNVLRAWIDGRLVTSTGYDAGRFAPGDTAFEGRSPGARLWLAADGTRARFRAPFVRRDVFYTERGSYAQDASEQLGPDEIFVLGDNSERSQDSREWGPVSTAEVLGRPVCVVWPPESWRWL